MSTQLPSEPPPPLHVELREETQLDLFAGRHRPNLICKDVPDDSLCFHQTGGARTDGAAAGAAEEQRDHGSGHLCRRRIQDLNDAKGLFAWCDSPGSAFACFLSFAASMPRATKNTPPPAGFRWHTLTCPPHGIRPVNFAPSISNPTRTAATLAPRRSTSKSIQSLASAALQTAARSDISISRATRPGLASGPKVLCTNATLIPVAGSAHAICPPAPS